jgi:hypothetical protein
MSGQKFPFNIPSLYSGTAFLIAVLAFVYATQAITQAMGGDTCVPRLAISDVHFTEMQPPTQSRTWSAVVSVDASECAAKGTGTFEIVFVREKETAPDLEFRERFVWRTPSVNVKVDFAADEAVQRYRIDNVTSCACGG